MKKIKFIKDGINPKFTLNRFVAGDSNKVAFESAKAVAKNPGKQFNPLFIYSEIGNGKTHLMHAIGNELKQNFPKFKVLYVTAEQFCDNFIDAIRKNTVSDFKNKYTKLDCLLLDDVQFLAGKEQSQEQIFNIFNSLKNNDKQIVAASSQKNLKVEKRLLSMFQWGLTVDIKPADLKTRKAILRKKVKENGFSVPNDVILFIARKIKSNIRELEGTLLRVASYTKFTNTPFTLNEVIKIFKDIIID